MDILEIIQNLTIIMEYLIPGVIFLAIIKWYTDKRISNNLLYIVVSVVISFFSKNILRVAHMVILKNISFGYEATFCFTTLLTVFLALILGILYHNENVKRVFNRVSRKTLHSNIWESLMDFKYGNTVMFVMKNGTLVCGTLHEIEEKGNDSWVALSSYICQSYSDDTEVYACSAADQDVNSVLVIRLADVVQAEVLESEIGYQHRISCGRK